MHTVLMTSSVDRTEPGGVQAVMDGLAARLRREGLKVVDLGSRPVARLPLSDRAWALPLLARGMRVWRRARFVWALLRHRPDVVNYHFATGDAAFFLRLRRLFGYRLVVSAHGSDVLRPEPQLRPRLVRILGGADAVTTVSRDLQRAVLDTPGVAPERVHLIPNGVDTDFWCPAPSPRTPDPRAPRLVAIGRCAPVKGFDVLIEAMAILRGRDLQVELTLIGDGAARAELEAQARARDLGAAVRFAGFLSPEEVRAAFRAADVFVMPSRSEGMPLALLEAMACGLVPVATRVGGIPEILGERVGVLVPPEDASELADALEGLLGASERLPEAGKAARERAHAFSSKAVDTAYLRAFRADERPAPTAGADATPAPQARREPETTEHG